MPLSPIDVTQQTFRVSLRGYDEGEVDAFLDDVVSSMKDYDQRLRDADERVSVLEEQLQANRETEEAMRRAFVVAQRTADEIVAEARVEGDRVVDDANVRAEATLAEASSKAVEISADQVRERDELEHELSGLRQTVSNLKVQLRALAEGALPDLERLDAEIEAAPTAPERSSLSARVAELSSAEEVAAHIPPFASIAESETVEADSYESGGFADGDESDGFTEESVADESEAVFEPFEDSYAAPEPSTDDVPEPVVEEPYVEESTPTEEVPRFGSHRADVDRSTFAPSSGGWLTSPNEPLPGRGMGSHLDDLATGEVPTVDDDAMSEDTSEAPSEWTEAAAEVEEHVAEPETRRRPWERDT